MTTLLSQSRDIFYPSFDGEPLAATADLVASLEPEMAARQDAETRVSQAEERARRAEERARVAESEAERLRNQLRARGIDPEATP
jgi:hypothetical protein